MNTSSTIMTGNLTKDIDVKSIQGSGGAVSVAKFSIAVNGIEKEDVHFQNCECWGVTADNLAKYCSKGDMILVRGRIYTSTWKDNAGVEQRMAILKADSFGGIEYLKTKDKGQGQHQQQGQGNYAPPPPPPQQQQYAQQAQGNYAPPPQQQQGKKDDGFPF